MKKENKEKVYEQLKQFKENVQLNLQNKPGYENYQVKDISKYNTKVKLKNKITNIIEEFDLCVAETENPNTKETMKLYYLNGKEINLEELMRIYESPKPIKDVEKDTKENEEKPENEQDENLTRETLSGFEKEVKKEEKTDEKKKDEKNKEQNQENIKRRPGAYLQIIDVDEVMIDDVRTFREAYNIPKDVKKIAFKYPVTDAEKVVSDDISFDMINKDGNSIDETKDGKRREDLFKVDDATGDNPMHDEVVHVNKDNDRTADNDSNSTLKRFIAVNPASNIENNGLNYISVRQKEYGGHVGIYSEGKGKYNNEVIGKQLDTTVTPVYTDNDVEKVFNSKNGEYNINEIENEASMHLPDEAGDGKTTAHENVDGDEKTVEECAHEFAEGTIHGTEMTWEQFAKAIGTTKEEAYKLFYDEKYENLEVNTRITRIINDKEEEKEQEDEGKGMFREGPWDKFN